MTQRVCAFVPSTLAFLLLLCTLPHDLVCLCARVCAGSTSIALVVSTLQHAAICLCVCACSTDTVAPLNMLLLDLVCLCACVCVQAAPTLLLPCFCKTQYVCACVQAAPISLRSAKAAINQGLETDLLGGMKVEEQQYAKARLYLEL